MSPSNGNLAARSSRLDPFDCIFSIGEIMFDTSKLSDAFIEPSNLTRDIPIGAVRVIPISAMIVDIDCTCWIDPDVEVLGDAHWRPTPGSSEGLVVKRSHEGLGVGRQFTNGHKWKKKVLPVRKADQFPWMRVVAVYSSLSRD
jgi:hypothetical protein